MDIRKMFEKLVLGCVLWLAILTTGVVINYHLREKGDKDTQIEMDMRAHKRDVQFNGIYERLDALERK